MKNRGIVRKIDELGRIVIPKEIRKSLNIEAMDDLEIFIEDDLIYLKKYSYMLNNNKDNEKLLNSIKSLCNGNIFISDKDHIITSGIIYNKKLNNKLKELLIERKDYISNDEEELIFDNEKIIGYFIIKPIIQNSDSNGLVIFIKDKNLNKEDELFVNIITKIVESR